MRSPLPLSLALLLVASKLIGADQPEPNETKADPYADDPYWYQPGHPVDPADATSIQTLPGFVAERVFTVPRELGSWTALGIDEKGRLLAAAQNQSGIYRITPAAANASGAETRVEKLSHAAAEIGFAHSLLVAFDSLYVTVAEANDQGLRSGVYRLVDTDNDDQYDQRTLLFALDASGEHGPHNLIVSPDGTSLIMMVGNATPVPAEITRRRPVSTTGVDHLMPPGFESSRHSTQGWVMQFRPDGSDREVLCSGLRNPFDLAVNEAGDLFTFDSDAEWDLGTPWYRPTRINHLVSGGEYGWRSDAAVWPEHFEDAVPPILNIGPGSPTGVIFGYGAAFPARYQRAMFALDWTFATIHAVFLDPEGATYRATSEVFLGGVGLPVTHAIIGQDGAMYLNVGGRRLGSAIYRVRYTGTESTQPAAQPSPLPELHRVRRELEAFHHQEDTAAVNRAWPYLGHEDRAIRYAARVAIERQPLDSWRERASDERNLPARLTAWLALARQGTPDDLARLLQRLADLNWSGLPSDDQLRALRVLELVFARSSSPAERPSSLLASLRPLLSSTDLRVAREAARLLTFNQDASVMSKLLDLMAADAGERPALGTEYFSRNPKYGQAVRDILTSAPLLERMHHAQMALWLMGQATPAERTRYFELIADAVLYSKGGHSYVEFWSRIQEAALAQAPAGERESLARIVAQPSAPAGVAPVPTPVGPGRMWSTEEVVQLVSTSLAGRSFENGQAMFAAASCASCHRLGATGAAFGPDLSALGQRFTLRDIVEAIVEPSRAISDQYQMVVVELRDGRTLAGRVVSRDAQSTALATNLMRPSQTTSVPTADITKEEVVPVSTMPAGLLDRLNPDEVADLIAFLVSGGDAAHSSFQRRP